MLLWPLGWAVAALITQGILDFMTDPSFKYIDPSATLYTLQASVGVAVLAFWIVFSTVAAPLVIQKVIAHGELAGGQLISGAFSSFLPNRRHHRRRRRRRLHRRHSAGHRRCGRHWLPS